MKLKEKIEELTREGIRLVEQSDTVQKLNDIRVEFLGKTGKIAQLMQFLREVPKDEKPAFGKEINAAKEMLEQKLKERWEYLKAKEMEHRLEMEKIDITLDPIPAEVGSLHPTNIVKREICDIFVGMGFTVTEGPEIETEYYNFRALNIPDDHPAREMQDTFYINDEVLLRTQTSPMQVRTMERHEFPIRIVNPGKVYRSDSDATHSPMFQQIEGLVVDEGITLCDLKGILELFAVRLFDKDTKVRFRPSYFPFTEPSVEVDVTCAMCHGKGCRLCHGTGWIEILGAGIVNPKVLEMSGIDSKKYSGLAFGLGVERITMIKYGLPDMRLLFENDVRLLKQFTKRG